MSTRTVRERAARLIRAATGEEWGDGYIVTDVVTGYAEPGYGSDESVVVFGDWNPPRFPREGDAPLTRAESLAPRLADALERVGANIEWLDEWSTCSECYRAVRTQSDAYSWKPFYSWVNECEIVCADCLREDINQSLDDVGAIDNADYCVTWCSDSELELAGWTQWEPSDPHTYENGWHPGQDDDPAAILASIKRETDADVVFRLHESSQFYITFRAYTRDAELDEYVSACPACGSPIDYCQGHGEIGDPAGFAILEAHDNDDHSECHPDGCDDAL